MQSLYTICLEILADHADFVPDYSNVPYEPYVHDLICTLMTRHLSGNSHTQQQQKKALCKALDTIGQAHSNHIRQKSEWTGVSIGYPYSIQKGTILSTISRTLPQFVCHIDLFGCKDVTNESLYLLKPCIHLSTLDISATAVSDLGVATLSRLNHPHLRYLSVANNSVSDMSLKYIGEIAARGCLEGVDLSGTEVDPEIATTFLASKGFARGDGKDKQKQLIGWSVEGQGYVTMKPNPWLADLLIDKDRPGPGSRPHQSNRLRVLFYVKGRNVVPADDAGRCNDEEKERRRRRCGRSDEGPKKKIKMKMDDYLAFIEQDMGLV